MADSLANFDGDFEKLSSADDEILVSSSTGTSHPSEFEGSEDLKTFEGVEDLKTDTPNDTHADATEFDQLIDFGEASEPTVDSPTESSSLPKVALSGDAHIQSVHVNEAHAPVAYSPEEPSTHKQSPVVAVLTTPVSDEPCSWLENVDSRVFDLLYWHDLKKTGAIFACTLSFLLSLALFSIISVIAYTSLIILTITISFRLYKTAMGTVQKGGDEHPFKAYLETEIALPEDKVHEYADIFIKIATDLLNTLRHIILIDDVIGSLKFGLLLWVMTYVGSWFNGMTLIILANVGVFTLPKVYDTYRGQINKNLDLVRVKIQDLQKIVQERVPFLGKTKQA